MLPNEDAGRGCRLREGSQIARKPLGVLLITIAYEKFISGSTGSFHEDDGKKLAEAASITLAPTHRTLPTRGRTRGQGATRKSTRTGCPPCSGTSYALPVSGAGYGHVPAYETINNTRAYVPTGGATAEAGPIDVENGVAKRSETFKGTVRY